VNLGGEVLSTGVRKLDELIGGGIIEDSIVLISYDSRSLGWLLGFEILKNRIVTEGDFGILTNTDLPLSKLANKLKIVGLDLFEEGKKGNLAVIDIFDLNTTSTTRTILYTILAIWNQTLLFRNFFNVVKQINSKVKGRRVIAINCTIDGLIFEFGRKISIKHLMSNLAMKEKFRISGEYGIKLPVNIVLSNNDRTPKEVTGWLFEISDYAIEFNKIVKDYVLIDRVTVFKSPLNGILSWSCECQLSELFDTLQPYHTP
jgi:hypothetical protein